ncbi:unnamed protein product [Fasciola hepatica]|uniref:Uncharacterized protein n=1 Tax=Fasciola hepatica TaxID=6192 RepID=A0ABC9HI02_FASHE
MDTEIIKITDASVKHNVTVFRGHLKQKSDEQMKFEVCKTEEDTKYRYRTRLKLNNCFHKSSAELQNNTRADFNTTKGFSNIGKKTTRTEESPPKHNALTGGTAKTTSKQGRTTESRNSVNRTGLLENLRDLTRIYVTFIVPMVCPPKTTHFTRIRLHFGRNGRPQTS